VEAFIHKVRGDMRLFKMIWVVLVSLVVVMPAMAQTGCIDSPENPTAILAVVGTAGGVLMALRSRLRRK
jgi:XrtJ-associated TM-motif-TM protein